MMTNRTAITMAVTLDPGHTAHYYQRTYGSRAVRWGWVYDAFRRAVSSGLIRQEHRTHTTVFWPAE
jgi:hypothetical protein